MRVEVVEGVDGKIGKIKLLGSAEEPAKCPSADIFSVINQRLEHLDAQRRATLFSKLTGRHGGGTGVGSLEEICRTQTFTGETTVGVIGVVAEWPAFGDRSRYSIVSSGYTAPSIVAEFRSDCCDGYDG